MGIITCAASFSFDCNVLTHFFKIGNDCNGVGNPSIKHFRLDSTLCAESRSK